MELHHIGVSLFGAVHGFDWIETDMVSIWVVFEEK